MKKSDVEKLQRVVKDFWSGTAKLTPEQRAQNDLVAANAGRALPMSIVSIDDLVQDTGHTRGTLNMYTTRPDFPSQVARTGKKKFWEKAAALKWFKDRKEKSS